MPHKLLILLVICLISLAAHAETPLTYDRIHLQGQADREVANDLLVAQLYVQRDGPSASTLADAVNREIAWALETAKSVPGVVVQSGGYRTSPVYNRSQLTGWRVRQSLRLESADAGVLGDLLGTLQQRVALESVGYQVSTERLREAGDALMLEALGAFRARAAAVTTALGAKGYRIVELHVGDAGGPAPSPRVMMAERAMASSAVLAPALEAGTRELTATANGTIELLRE